MPDIVTLTLNPTVDITGEVDRLGRLLDEEGLDHRAVAIAGETREAVILLVGDRRGSYHLGPSGPRLTWKEGRACVDVLLAGVPPGGYAVLSGSLPDGLPADLYGAVARKALEAEVRVVLYTSGAALRAALEAGVHLVKPNNREAAELIGRQVETFADARAVNERLLRRGGAQIAVTTLGEHGALCSSPAGHHEIHNPPLPSEVLSDAGACDSLVAGIVTGLAAGLDEVEACVLGVAAASASVLTPGTETKQPMISSPERSTASCRVSSTCCDAPSLRSDTATRASSDSRENDLSNGWKEPARQLHSLERPVRRSPPPRRLPVCDRNGCRGSLFGADGLPSPPDGPLPAR